MAQPVRPSLRDRLNGIFEVPGARSRTPSLEGIRGLAILLVFFVHYDALFSGYLSAGSVGLLLSRFAGHIGHTGVDLFFVLSGSLIYGIVMRGKPSYAGFLQRRVLRIYPAFLVALVLYLALSDVFPAESKLPSGGWAAAGYILQNVALLPGILNITPIMTVAWSLSYEAAFYIVVPIVVWRLKLPSWSPRARVTLIAAVSLAYLAGCLGAGLPHVRLVMFGAGMLLYEALESSRFKERMSARGEAAAIALLAATFPLVFVVLSRTAGVRSSEISWSAGVSAVLFVSFFWFVAYASGFNGVVKRVCSLDPLRWLGNISYSFYLIHGLALKGLALACLALLPVATHGAGVFWAGIAVAGPVTVLTSALLFFLVERPYSLGRQSRQRPLLEPELLPLEFVEAQTKRGSV